MVEQANDKFSATMTNVVQWREAEQSNSSSNGSSAGSSLGAAGAAAKEICSDTSIQVVLEVPGWFVIPTGMIEATGGLISCPAWCAGVLWTFCVHVWLTCDWQSNLGWTPM